MDNASRIKSFRQALITQEETKIWIQWTEQLAIMKVILICNLILSERQFH